MGWPLREVPFPLDRPVGQYPAGTCYRIPLDHPYSDGKTYGETHASRLSPEFLATGRDYVVWILLPGDCSYWCPDFKASGSESGWRVSGELPAITVHPSIDAEGCYHGWLRDGVLTDDLEGRTYP